MARNTAARSMPRRAGARTAAAPTVAALVALCVAALVNVAAHGTAYAHARLLRSAPADGQAVAASPATLDLWFNEILDQAFNSVEVYRADAEGKSEGRVESGPPAVDANDPTHLSSRLPALPPGGYVVHWKVLSRDGHTARGRTEFRVTAGAAP